uniref:Protein trichome birefringence-like 8 isoform X1 n=1 Tax=Rhizophora mucronata TaxID=61149 RepID=A0A2P2LIV6_RHIMU
MMVILHSIGSKGLQFLLHKTAAIGVYQGYLIYGMKFSMLNYYQWDSEQCEIYLARKEKKIMISWLPNLESRSFSGLYINLSCFWSG